MVVSADQEHGEDAAGEYLWGGALGCAGPAILLARQPPDILWAVQWEPYREILVHAFLRPHAFLLLVLTVAPAVAADEVYAIKLNRRPRAGQVFREHTSLNAKRTVTTTQPSGQVDNQTQNVLADLDYRVTVKAVDEFGDATELSVQVLKFAFGTDAKEALPKGSIFGIRRSEKEVTLSFPDGKTMSSEQQWALQFIFTPLQPALNHKKLSVDDVWGSKTSRKVGEEWDANPDKVARAISTTHTIFDPQGTSSKIKLMDAETTPSGERALRIKVTVDMATPKSSDLMPSFSDQKSQSQFVSTKVLPIDETRPMAEEATLFDLNWKGTDTQTRAVTQVQMHYTLHTVVTPIP